MNAADLIAFTAEVSARYDAGEISGPVHLNSDTQIEPLIEIFRNIKRTDWVLGTWRSMYHALLHGVPRYHVMREVLAGRSMQLHFPEHRFMTSSIVGGMLPIATGLAAEGERVFCFVGDMCASTGAFQDAHKFIVANRLPAHFIVENNGLSTNTPTDDAWGDSGLYGSRMMLNRGGYDYERTTPHYGTGNGAGF